jgi:hypothetical protein
LWLQGFPDDAKREADQCVREALQLDHEQTLCWALVFSVCPIAIWRGDREAAKGFIDLLLERSKNAFQHYHHEWSFRYRAVVDAGSSTSAGCFTELDLRNPARIDLFATFDEKFLEPANLARFEADPDNWCAAEILRCSARRRLMTEGEAGQAEAEAALVRSLDIARGQGARAWELRAATTLAGLYRRLDRIGEGRSLLQPVLVHFTQGHDTRDVRAATRLLSELAV